MKVKYLLIFTFLFLVLACNKSTKKQETKKELTEQEKALKKYKYAELELGYQKEKIFLLSEIKRIKYDTLYQILKEYIANTPEFIKYEKSPEKDLAKIIEDISIKLELSKAKVASVIFSYKYEMMTQEEIVEKAADEYQNSQIEVEYDSDRYDPLH